MSMVVTGATGFIGRHLIEQLAACGEQVRALTRREPPKSPSLPGVQWVVGDLADPATWERLLEPGCTVFNLAYSTATVASGAIEAAEHMVECCASGKISRLVHCSTVSVYGQVDDPVATETTPCQPRNAYGQIKLDIEQVLVDKVAGRFECVIVRPSSVFGDGSLALTKAIRDLREGSMLLSYLRACLFGDRRAHLVPIETVIAALLHLSRLPLAEPAERFIISDDLEPINNFRDVERILQEELSIPDFPVQPLPLPRMLLEVLLRVMGRSNANTRLIYSPGKLRASGFIPPVSLEDALRRFIREHEPPSNRAGAA